MAWVPKFGQPLEGGPIAAADHLLSKAAAHWGQQGSPGRKAHHNSYDDDNKAQQRNTHQPWR